MTPHNKGYIIMNEDGLFFAGFEYGKFKWSLFEEEAKPLYDDGHKFDVMQMLWCPEKELIKEEL